MNQIKCNCEGTNRIGERCSTSFLNVSPIELLSVNQIYKVIIASSLSDSRAMSIKTSEPSIITVDPNSITLGRDNEDNYQIMATYPGIYRVSYSIDPSDGIIIPDDSIVMVTDTDVQGETDYSDIIALEEGMTDPGCCSHVVSRRSKCLSNLTFSSSCDWNSRDSHQVSSKGVIFVKSKTINLPLSISGVSIGTANMQLSMPLESSTECSSCSKQQSYKCTSINFDVYGTRTFLSRNSLVKMLLSRIQHFFPSWLSINAEPSIESPSYSVYDYISSLVIGNDLKNLPSCSTLDIYNKDYLYYVLRTNVPLQIMIDSFTTFLYPSPECIVIDMCSDINPKVYFNVPPTLQPSKLINLKYFQDLLSKRDNLKLKSFIIANKGISQEVINNQIFWDGNEYITPAATLFEFQVTAEFNKMFAGGDLVISYTFEGSAFHTSTITDNAMVCNYTCNSLRKVAILTACMHNYYNIRGFVHCSISNCYHYYYYCRCQVC